VTDAQPTRELAGFFADLRYDSLPAAVRERVTDIVLDTVASALAGRHGDETAQIEALADAIGGPKTSTVIAGPKQSLAGATLVNGYQVTAVTVCDIHRPTLCHVTPEVVPPALAVAEERGASGRDLLVAVATGLEAVVRAGAGMRYKSMRARGWHSPGVIGPFGGATAVASLLGLDAARFQNALSLAGTQSAGTFAHWGTPTIKFHQSRGAYSGLLAGLLAEQGFKAGPEIFTADHGGLFNLYSDGGDPAAAVAGLGEDWMLNTISLRLWPAASGDHCSPGSDRSQRSPPRRRHAYRRRPVENCLRHARDAALGQQIPCTAVDTVCHRRRPLRPQMLARPVRTGADRRHRTRHVHPRAHPCRRRRQRRGHRRGGDGQDR